MGVEGKFMGQKYTLFSLFSGAGGLDLGFESSGSYDVILGNDVFEISMETFSANFGIERVTQQPVPSNLPVLFSGKVEDLDFEALEDLNPDVIAGGPPCQDFSIVRGPTAEGISVSRGRLYSHFIRALVYLRPKVFVFENVPGLVSMNRGKTYQTIIDDFSSLDLRWREIREKLGNSSNALAEGYRIVYNDVVDASGLGVPQKRKRLIVVGLRKDLWKSEWGKTRFSVALQNVEKVLEGKESLLRKYPLTTIETFEGKPLPDLQNKYEDVMREYEKVGKEVGTSRAREWEKKVFENLSFDIIRDYLSVNEVELESQEEFKEALKEHRSLLKKLGYYNRRVSDIKPENNNELSRVSKQVRERMRRVPPDQNHEFVRDTEWEVEGRGMSLIYRRLHPLKPSYTVVAKGGGGTWGYHYERDREKLTNRERARLQTFPDEFQFKGNISEVRSQIGEAVPPLLGKKIAEVIAGMLEKIS